MLPFRYKSRTQAHMSDAEFAEFRKGVAAMSLEDECKKDFEAKLREANSERMRIDSLVKSIRIACAASNDPESASVLATYLTADEKETVRLRRVLTLRMFPDDDPKDTPVGLDPSPLQVAEKDARHWKRLLEPPSKAKDGLIDVEQVRLVPIKSLYDLGKSVGLTYKCPFHDDRSPSFAVYEHDNHAHCYGCGWHGDNIKFVMDLHETSFRKACQLIISQ